MARELFLLFRMRLAAALLFTSVSTNTTLTTDTQLVVITAAVTVTLPVSPVAGQIVYMYTTDNLATVDPNSKTLYYSGTSTTIGVTFYTVGNIYAMIFVYNGTGWYLVGSS